MTICHFGGGVKHSQMFWWVPKKLSVQSINNTDTLDEYRISDSRNKDRNRRQGLGKLD